MTVLSFYRTNFCMIFIFEVILYECFILTKFRSSHNSFLVDRTYLIIFRILGFRIFRISTPPKERKPLSSIIQCPEKVRQLDLSKVGTRSSIDVSSWIRPWQTTLAEKQITLAEKQGHANTTFQLPFCISFTYYCTYNMPAIIIIQNISAMGHSNSIHLIKNISPQTKWLTDLLSYLVL